MDTYEYFKKEVYEITGINLNLYKEKQMKRRISSLVNRNGFKDFDDYYQGLKKDKKLFNEFINYLTINVSEFFRNLNQWEVLQNEVLPELVNHNKILNVWSSACSTGEEPYTMVMLLTDFFKLHDIQILATDLDVGAIEKAKLGIYSEKSIQNVPAKYKERFFSRIGNSYKIDDSIKSRVKFKQHNLLKDPYPNDMNFILCRNVMIYFTEEAKVEMYKKFHKSLSEDGVFFVGSTEQIILPDRYGFKPIRTFFYRKLI